MWTSLLAITLIFASASARPQEPVPPTAALAQSAQPTVEIVAQSDVVNPNGSFTYSYELSNGVKVQETGFVKPNPVASRSGAAGEGEDDSEINVAQGSFSYTAPDGTVISLTYTADENGFHPEGDHLPTSPPIPEAIARALSAQPPEPEGAAPTGFGGVPPTGAAA